MASIPRLRTIQAGNLALLAVPSKRERTVSSRQRFWIPLSPVSQPLLRFCLRMPREIPAASPPRPHATPFPEEKSMPGVIYGVLLWAGMNAATPLGARGRSVISLAFLPTHALCWTEGDALCSDQ